MTYSDMAQRLGVAYCAGTDHYGKTGYICDVRWHTREGAALGNIVHFAERQPTKYNTLAFLKLVAKVRDPSLADDVPWRRIYRMDKLARQAADELGIRLPSRLFATDRAFVLAGVAGISNDVPMRKQAFDWARR